MTEVGVDPRFERAVLAELALSERRVRRHDRSRGARALARRLHRGRHDLLAHLRRVALAVPSAFRPVAWLHHARETHATSRALTAAGLTAEEVAAVDLLARAGHRSAGGSVLHRARLDGDSLAALALLPDPRLTA